MEIFDQIFIPTISDEISSAEIEIFDQINNFLFQRFPSDEISSAEIESLEKCQTDVLRISSEMQSNRQTKYSSTYFV